MAYYIFTKNGVEISRKERTRGRPPLGAKLAADGNYYIEETEVPDRKQSSTSSTSTSTVTTKPTTVVDNKPVTTTSTNAVAGTTSSMTIYPMAVASSSTVAEPVERIKVFKEKFPALVEHIISCLWWEKRHYKEVGDSIIIEQPCVVKKPSLEHLKFNAHYAKVELDKADKAVKIWSTYPTGEPTYVLKNALI